MAALLNFFKQVWTSIVDAYKGCCGKQTSVDEAATAATPVEISTAPDGEVIVETREITSGGGGKTNADLLGSLAIDDQQQYTGSGTTTIDLLATSMITRGGGGKTN